MVKANGELIGHLDVSLSFDKFVTVIWAGCSTVSTANSVFRVKKNRKKREVVTLTFGEFSLYGKKRVNVCGR